MPLYIFDPMYRGEYEMASLPNAGLSNVAATLLSLMGYTPPEGYDPALISFKR